MSYLPMHSKASLFFWNPSFDYSESLFTLEQCRDVKECLPFDGSFNQYSIYYWTKVVYSLLHTGSWKVTNSS